MKFEKYRSCYSTCCPETDLLKWRKESGTLNEEGGGIVSVNPINHKLTRSSGGVQEFVAQHSAFGPRKGMGNILQALRCHAVSKIITSLLISGLVWSLQHNNRQNYSIKMHKKTIISGLVLSSVLHPGDFIAQCSLKLHWDMHSSV
ncbi:MAG: hypothetical protein A4E58_02348 [Syntrophorhabdus sp. PtaB.Bin006]|nr:MAG: hypothetical protein A4E58_02348 [Syntrophorhabdus sp. PtaB.Bin006]